MNEIKCTNCGKIFQVDESGLADIVKQVRDREFAGELANREAAWKTNKENEIALLREKAKNHYESEFAKLKNELTQKDAVLVGEMARKDAVITELNEKIKTAKLEEQLSLKETLSQVEKERDHFKNVLDSKDTEKNLSEKLLKEKYETELKAKDEQIAYYKDFKAKQSTKLVGESLEKHCEYEFNRLRAIGFQNAYFEKDNDAKTGSKGDYIYRENDENGNEIISIMFEMKNEEDNSQTKKYNTDFLDKLNKNRMEKNCEYAVLVSLLEQGEELYNNGIVDVSHKHPKMYVIRPQFFIPVITFLRNAALNAQKYKAELAVIKNQNIDITRFEEKLLKFKEASAKNYSDSANRYNDAIKSIDKAIENLQKTKDALTLSKEHLGYANDKAEELTIRRLTHGNPTMTEMFAELREKSEGNAD
ncbi:MAG: DUF2130 domain-containing protein [Firmicutes bacterium]|nr:DUF2130 domain-containing protein [Bacillota bacterium]